MPLRVPLASVQAAILLAVIAPPLAAQTAFFSGAQSLVPLGPGIVPSAVASDTSGNIYVADAVNSQVVEAGWSAGAFTVTVIASQGANGLSNPSAVAVDPAGNVFIADTGNNRVLKETLSSTGYTQSVVASQGLNSLNHPAGVAVDPAGNVYIADQGNNRVLKESPSLSGYSQSVVAAALLGPRSVAVDATGSLYIADANISLTVSQVLKETPASGSYTQTVVATSSNNAIKSPSGIAVDAAGSIYIADSALAQIIEEVIEESPANGAYMRTVLAGKSANGLSAPQGLAVDWSGSIYVADPAGANLIKLQPQAANFGMVPAGSSSWTSRLTFTFNITVTLGSPAPARTLIMGAPTQEFVDAGTGSCKAGRSYAAGTSCTVDLAFLPAFSGPRNGALQLLDSNGNAIATALVSGIGTGPQIASLTGIETPAAIGLGMASDIATDSAGSLYVADEGAAFLNAPAAVYKLAPATGVKTPLGAGWQLPLGLALNGAGSVYVADYEQAAVIKIAPDGAQTTVPIAVKGPIGLAADPAGNLFVADTAAAAVYKLSPSRAITTVGSGFIQPDFLALDSFGNLYVGDFATNSIYEITPAGIQTLLTDGIPYPQGIKVDAAGTVYVAGGDASSPAIYQISPSDQLTTLLSLASESYPKGLALDAAGNLFIADSNAGESLPSSLIGEYDRGSPPPAYSFITATPVDTEDTTDGAKTAAFQNIGTDPLDFSADPVYPASFLVNTADTRLCSAAAPLAPGTICDVSAIFSPAVAGSIAASLNLSDNSLNQPAAQSIALSGTGVGKSQTITFAPLTSPVSFGVAPIALSASASSGLPVAFSVLSGPASVSDSLLSITGVGTVVVAADQPGGGIYVAATEATQTIAVTPGTQTIAFTPPASPETFGAAPITLSATATSGQPVTFSILSGPAIVAGNIVTLTGAGTIVLAAGQPGNANYQPASEVTQTIVVNPAPQTIALQPLPASVNYGSRPISLSASSTSGLPVVISLISGPGTINGTLLSITGAGAISIAASQPGSANYLSAPPVISTVTVRKASQTIAFAAPKTPLVYGVRPITLQAKSSARLLVEFTVVSGPAQVKNAIVEITGAGTVVLAASQPGNSNYEPAAQVRHSIVVDKAKLAVAAISLTVKQGSRIPTLAYKVSGLVDGDSQKSAISGAPKLTTTATSKSKPGKYPIEIAAGNLSSKNYRFAFTAGTLRVEK